MDITIRLEQNDDYKVVENLTKEAFWNLHVPGCDEHYLIHTMRDHEDFVNELDCVATIEEVIVGHIAYARSQLLLDDNNMFEVLCLGPISVHPKYQGLRIGRRLFEYTKEVATTLGYSAILLYGEPLLYSKWGFLPAEGFFIRSSENKYVDALQAMELYPGALGCMKGRFIESPCYQIDTDKAEEFDRLFPKKERLVDTPSQIRFKEVLTMVKPAQ